MAKKKMSSSTDILRRQEIYEKAKTFEERVAELYRFLGCTTTLDYQKDALQFDIRLEMSGGPLPIHALVECKDTGKPAGQKQIREFASKVEHARRADVLLYQAILVSRSGFVNNAHEVARQHHVYLRTFEELILSFIDFVPTLEAAVSAFRGTELERLYVEQDVVVQRGFRPGPDFLRSRGLTETVHSWLAEPRKTFLALLGDFGTGKTSFCQRLACDLATRVREQPGSARIPVIIDLRAGGSTTVTLENLLTHHFQCLSSRPFNPQSLLYLNREGYLVLLFDGFDEVIAYSEPSRYLDNLRQILRAAEGEAKVILTCRTHYFRDRPDEIRALGGQSSELLTDGATRLYEELGKKPGVDVVYLREFTEEQIETYLRKAVPPPGNWQKLRDQIRHTYNLRDLAERPFLLEIIVKTLPKLQTVIRPSQVTVADLYSTYCESWFDHTDFRLTLTRERKLALVEHLARKLWNAPDQRVHYRDLFEDCTSFFSDRPLTPHEKDKIDFEVRTALFLHRDEAGHYSFIHRSFLEFFVARTLQAGLQTGDAGCLDCRRLTREVAFFLTFWPEAERIPALAGQVLAGPYQPRISENALQLLSFYTRSRFAPLVGPGAEARDSVENLRKIRSHFRTLRPLTIHLEGADLEGADLRGIDLEDACLTEARLDRAQLQGASLARARCDGASLAFVNAWKASFAGTCLADVHLEHAQCRGADFQDADLTGADLSFASVSHGVIRPASPEGIKAVEAGLPDLFRPLDTEGWREDPQLARQATVLFVDSRTELTISRMARPPELATVERDRPLPIAPNQRRLWFLTKFNPSLPYVLSLVLDLRGRLSVSAFYRSISEIVRRHEILRATFQDLEGSAVLQITSETAVSLPLIDLRSLPVSVRQRVANRLISSVAQDLPDLFQGPLFRVTLLALSLDEHVAILTMHQMIGDERSRDLLACELGSLYREFSQKASPSPPEPDLGFADFAVWQWQRQEQVITAEIAYSREQLTSAPVGLTLPTDRPRPAFSTYRGAHHRLRLAEDTAGEIRSLAGLRKTTALIVLLTAFELLLARHADWQTVVVGLPVHGRHYAMFERMIGPFEDIRVLCTDLTGNPTFEKLLERVREVALAAHACELSFAQLVEVLQPERSLAQTPLFQITFSFRRKVDIGHFDELTVTTLEPDVVTAPFDLSLTVTETGPSFSVELIYSVDLFDTTTTHRILRHFENLLLQAVGAPTLMMENLAFLSPSELQQVTVEWNDSTYSFSQSDMYLHELVEAQAKRTPCASAIAFEDQVLTYSHLNRLADQWAERLRNLGVGPEVRVGIYMERSLEMVIGLLAILKSGGTYLPLDPEYPRERTRFMLQESRVLALLSQRRLTHHLSQFEAQVLYLDEPVSRHPVPSMSSQLRALPDNLCYLIYTSGSTGRPKGVMNTHRGVVNSLLGLQASHRLTPKDRVLQLARLGFDPSIQEIFWPLISGACLVLAQPRWSGDPLYLTNLIAEQSITTLRLPSAALGILLERLDIGADYSTLFRVLVGGDVPSAESQRQFLQRLGFQGTELHNRYGPTEASINVTSCQLTETTSSFAIGRPVANARIYLLDRHLQPVAVGVPGQLYIGGVQLARGYDNRPELTAERFLPNPFSTEPGKRMYATGDLARYIPQGSIEFLGRLDYQVKIRGFRIELGEIESALRRQPEVRDAVVIAREDYPGERRLVAYILPAGMLTLDELRNALQDEIPAHMVPASFVFLEAFPLNSNGKIDRRALPAPAAERPDLSSPFVAPRNNVEQSLALVWSEILRIEKVGVHDNFFDLGGHSLNATQVTLRIRKSFDIDLSLRHLFESPTVAKLADIVIRLRGRH